MYIFFWIASEIRIQDNGLQPTKNVRLFLANHVAPQNAKKTMIKAILQLH